MNPGNLPYGEVLVWLVYSTAFAYKNHLRMKTPFHRKHTHIFLTFMVLAMMGCAKNSDFPVESNALAPTATALTHEEMIEATSRVTENLTPCDTVEKSVKLNLLHQVNFQIQELQRQRNEEAQNQPPDSTSTHLWRQFGSLWLYVAPRGPRPNQKWIQVVYGWASISEELARLKDNRDLAVWENFQERLIRLIYMDHTRLVYQQPFYLRFKDKPVLLRTISLVKKCAETPGCHTVQWPPEMLKAWMSSSRYSQWLNYLKGTPSVAERNEALKQILGDLTTDFDLKFKLIANPGMTRVSRGEYLVSVNLSHSSPELSTEITKIIQDVWKNNRYHVTVDPVNVDDPKTIQFELFPGQSGVSAAQPNPPKIFLYDNETIWTLAHEFGHTLGLKDNYDTLWNTEKCSYIEDQDVDDLMSSVENGKVTDADWATLDQLYPFQN